MSKRLYRSRKDSVIGGVCGGLGEYLDVDPVIVRVALVLLVLAKGLGILAYIIAWIVMPQRPEDEIRVEEGKPATVEPSNSAVREKKNDVWVKFLPGVILIAIGMYFLADEFWWWWRLDWLAPALLVGGGLYLIFRGTRNKSEANEREGGVHESSQV